MTEAPQWTTYASIIAVCCFPLLVVLLVRALRRAVMRRDPNLAADQPEAHVRQRPAERRALRERIARLRRLEERRRELP